eukprot:Rmarinus@m.22468
MERIVVGMVVMMEEEMTATVVVMILVVLVVITVGMAVIVVVVVVLVQSGVVTVVRTLILPAKALLVMWAALARTALRTVLPVPKMAMVETMIASAMTLMIAVVIREVFM